MRIAPHLLTLLAGLLLVAPAAAQENGYDDGRDEVAPPPAAVSESARWYGWKTLLVDGAAYGTGWFLPPAGLALYAFGAPAVHAAQGEPGRMMGSLGLRVGAPTALALVGYGAGTLACARTDDDVLPCPFVVASVGFISGMLAAVAIDAAVLARTSPPGSAPPPSTEPPPPALGITPQVQVGPRAAFAGVVLTY